ncbi:MAG: hypothetical protein ACTSUX_07830 [Promethearchaeota archaeon]
MEDNRILALSSLFDALGVIEKGIEKVYHYLLVNKRIDNLKDVASQFDLSLKRCYKICSVLNDLELVHIYDRPMKIHLSTPVLPIWQKLVNNRIEELTYEFQEKKKRAESALEDFLNKYHISEEVIPEFVEFRNYDLKNFSETYSEFLAKKECKIAIGIKYENDLIYLLKKNSIEKLPKDIKDGIDEGILRFNENLKNLDIEVILNAELLRELLSMNEFKVLSNYLNKFDLGFKKFLVNVTYDDFSNFILTDNELIQPSFDPSKKLIGAYLSRNNNIYQIFYDKFKELFEKGIPINEFIKDQEDIKIKYLNPTQCLVLCLL